MTRKDLAKHFASLGFTRGAEIGVERGKFSEVLCQSIPGLWLLAVDSWCSRPGYREHVSAELWTEIAKDARRRLAPYRVTVGHGGSVNVAKWVGDGSLDFVYIDADHSEAAVLADLMAWMPKVRKGGIVSGHDWNLGSVKRALEGVTQHVSVTLDRSPSWWFTRG